jgi:hypothetical protein
MHPSFHSFHFPLSTHPLHHPPSPQVVRQQQRGRQRPTLIKELATAKQQRELAMIRRQVLCVL